jgi:hypothetical protein
MSICGDQVCWDAQHGGSECPVALFKPFEPVAGNAAAQTLRAGSGAVIQQDTGRNFGDELRCNAMRGTIHTHSMIALQNVCCQPANATCGIAVLSVSWETLVDSRRAMALVVICWWFWL